MLMSFSSLILFLADYRLQLLTANKHSLVHSK